MSDYPYIAKAYGKDFHVNDIVKLDELPDALNGRVLKQRESHGHYVYVEYSLKTGNAKPTRGFFHPGALTVLWSAKP